MRKPPIKRVRKQKRRRLVEPEFWEDEDAMLEEWMFSAPK
jgi:hypothetical protein